MPDRKISSLGVKSVPASSDYVLIVDSTETNANFKEKLAPISGLPTGGGGGGGGGAPAPSDKSIVVYTLSEFQALNPATYSTVFFNGQIWMYESSRNRSSLGNQGETYVTPSGSTSGTGAWEVVDRMSRSNAHTLTTNTTFTHALNPVVLSDNIWRYHQFVTANAPGLTLTLERTYKIYNVGSNFFAVVAGTQAVLLEPGETAVSYYIGSALQIVKEENEAVYSSVSNFRSNIGSKNAGQLLIGGRLLEYVYDASDSTSADDGINVLRTPNSSTGSRRYVRKDRSTSVLSLSAAQAVDPVYFPIVFYEGSEWYYDANYSRALIATHGGQGVLAFSPSGSTTGNGAFRRKHDALSPRMFGAVGDGTTNDTTALQSLFNVAALLGVGVVLTGNHLVTNVRIKNGMKFLRGPGKLIGSSATPEAVLELDGPYWSSTAVSNCEINVTIDGGAVARRGIFCSKPVEVTFRDCNISNLRAYAGVALDVVGIRFHQGGKRCKILGGTITLPIDNPYGSYSTAAGVQLLGTGTDGFGGLTDSGFVAPTETVEDTQIIGLTVLNGTHSILNSFTTRTVVQGCSLQKPTHRCVNNSPQAIDGVITGNEFLDYGSSAVNCGYGSSGNLVAANKCKSTVSPGGAGESSLQAYIGSPNCQFFDNVIDAPRNYGVYFGPDSAGVAEGNEISTAVLLAGIAVETDWYDNPPALSLYARPNYLPPPAGNTSWGKTHMDNLRILNNTFKGFTGAGKTQLALISHNGKKIRNPIISKNIAEAPASTHSFHIYEEISGDVSGIRHDQNDWGTTVRSRFSFPRGRAHFASMRQNFPFNNMDGDIFVDTSNSATPSVALADSIYLSYTVATNVTDFIDDMLDQTILVRLSVNVTLVHDTTKMRLKGSTNATGNDANRFISLKNIAGIWFEQYRNW